MTMDLPLSASDWQLQSNAKSYLSLVAITILYYDYCLTLPMEVERYWTLKGFTWTRFLFYLSRYTSLLAHVPVIVAYFWSDEPFNKVEICNRFHSFHSYYVVAAQLVMGVILTIRTYALYGHNRRILYIICPVIVTLVAVGSWAIASSDEGYYHPDPTQVKDWPRIGCIESLTRSGGIHLAIAWSGLLAFDLTIYLLTLRKAFGSRRVPGKSLVQIILRDASIYVGVIVVVNVSIVLTLTLAPAALKGASTILSTCIASVMISRLLLNLRDPSFSARGPTVIKSSLHFGSPNVNGNGVTDTSTARISVGVGSGQSGISEDVEPSVLVRNEDRRSVV